MKDPRNGKIYSDFQDCVNQNNWADDPEKYCGWVKAQSEGFRSRIAELYQTYCGEKIRCKEDKK